MVLYPLSHTRLIHAALIIVVVITKVVKDQNICGHTGASRTKKDISCNYRDVTEASYRTLTHTVICHENQHDQIDR